MRTTGAELILAGAPVYTADAARRWAGGVAVGGGRILAVGAERDVLALAGPATRVVRLDGGMVVPGFQDAHAHPLTAGLDRRWRRITGNAPPASSSRRISSIRRRAEHAPGNRVAHAPWRAGFCVRGGGVCTAL